MKWDAMTSYLLELSSTVAAMPTSLRTHFMLIPIETRLAILGYLGCYIKAEGFWD